MAPSLSLKEAQKLHAHLLKVAMDQQPRPVSELVEFFALFPSGGFFQYACQLFGRITHPNLFIYNTMIRGAVMSGRHHEAIRMYRAMRDGGMVPNNFTFPFVLNACEHVSAIKQGEEVHGVILRCGFQSILSVMTTLLNMYSGCGQIGNAVKVFDEVPQRDVVSWNSMIAGYLRHGDIISAQNCFDRMGERSSVSWNSMVSGYANLGEIEKAEQLFERMPMRDVVSWNSMIGAYCHLGDVEGARRLFDTMPERDTVTWSSLINGYTQVGRFNDALILFRRMQLADVMPSEVAVVGALSACANLGALDVGRWVHDYIKKQKLVINNNVGTALIDMYAKCGSVEMGLSVFHFIKNKDVVAWTAMIVGFALNGRSQDALEFFDRMLNEKLKPDAVTFLGVLNACSHAGLVTQGQQYFTSMRNEYGITPKIEHYSCMVDLLGRAGLLGEAEMLVFSMPYEPDAVMLGSLFFACRMHGNSELGTRVLDHLLKMEPQNGGNYILLSNIYATSGRWHAVAAVRKLMKEKGIKRDPGCSSIETGSDVYEFVAGDLSHPQSKEIYEMLDLVAGQQKLTGYKSIFCQKLAHMKGSLVDHERL
ncbi:Pentatricopeptide repeat-containing protein [Nymphaea thermarum]|nr:Pentatricopeptide repeat-containing protein [Nymphaea thermarum]